MTRATEVCRFRGLPRMVRGLASCIWESGHEEVYQVIGLDVQKDSKWVAVAEHGRGGEVRYMGTIGTTTAALDKLVARLCGDGAELRLCYEAGPCGAACPCEGGGRPSSSDGDRRGLRGRGAVADPAPAGRPGEDRPARRGDAGGGAPRRYADGGVGVGCGSRGDARSGSGSRGALRQAQGEGYATCARRASD